RPALRQIHSCRPGLCALSNAGAGRPRPRFVRTAGLPLRLSVPLLWRPRRRLQKAEWPQTETDRRAETPARSGAGRGAGGLRFCRGLLAFTNDSAVDRWPLWRLLQRLLHRPTAAQPRLQFSESEVRLRSSQRSRAPAVAHPRLAAAVASGERTECPLALWWRSLVPAVGDALLHVGTARPAASGQDLRQAERLQGLRADLLLHRALLPSGDQ